MAKATHLIFSLFNVTLGQKVPFGIPQYVQYILHGLTCALSFVFHSYVFADSKNGWFGAGLHVMEFPFILYQLQYFDYAVAFQILLDPNWVVTGWM